MLDTILTYDATGGGANAAVAPTSLTIKMDGKLVGYYLDGISAEDVVITCATNPAWDAAGIKLSTTSDGTAIGAGDQFRYMTHKVPVKKGDVLVVTTTSGANPNHVGLFVEYPGGLAFKPRGLLESEGYLTYKATAAGGTNCAAGTIVYGATDVTGFGQGRTYTPVGITSNAAFTTTPFIGIRKKGGDNVWFIVPIGLTDVADDMKYVPLPHGLFTVTQGDAIELCFSSATAEQPTADIQFVY